MKINQELKLKKLKKIMSKNIVQNFKTIRLYFIVHLFHEIKFLFINNRETKLWIHHERLEKMYFDKIIRFIKICNNHLVKRINRCKNQRDAHCQNQGN